MGLPKEFPEGPIQCQLASLKTAIQEREQRGSHMPLVSEVNTFAPATSVHLEGVTMPSPHSSGGQLSSIALREEE